MNWRRKLALRTGARLLLLASIATSLGACVTSEGPAPVSPLAPSIQVTLPPPPEGVEVCLRRSFPEIPDRALSKADIVRIIGKAKILDRAKTACGRRATDWIADVLATYAKPEPAPAPAPVVAPDAAQSH